jgi:radical SAM superfamily enzyme YgiQ (UPF0313 family)
MDEDILLQVTKPARYIGGEWNAARKDFDAAQVKFALCFPDLYEVGMSNLGLRVLYGVLNAQDGVVCGRFFSPGLDMEEKIRQGQRPFWSLEHQKTLAQFDLVGFSLGYELVYTNVLAVLDLGGIPLESKDRGAAHPLVIGGGTCALNPEPIADFFDLFVIGEGEEVVLEIVELYRVHRDRFRSGHYRARSCWSSLRGSKACTCLRCMKCAMTPPDPSGTYIRRRPPRPCRSESVSSQILTRPFFPLTGSSRT